MTGRWEPYDEAGITTVKETCIHYKLYVYYITRINYRQAHSQTTPIGRATKNFRGT